MEQEQDQEALGGRLALGLMLGALLGAGLALLLTSHRGSRTRRQWARRIRELREEAADELQAAGSRARRELSRRTRRLQRRLERARDRLS